MRTTSRAAVSKRIELSASPFCRDYAITRYDVEMFCSLSTVFRTVGRFSIRSCHAV